MVKRVKGMQDWYGGQACVRARLKENARRLFERYGFRELETPLMEYTELFRRSTGEDTDIVTKEMYSLPDSKGRSQSLRPEGTPAVVRALLEEGLQEKFGLPLKLYYIGAMFRHERPQKGRYRQHTQMGVELFGAPGAEADLEVMTLAYRLMSSAGVKDVELLYNSIGCAECRPAYLKVLKGFLAEKGDSLCENCRQRFEKNPLRVLDCKEPGCGAIAKESPLVREHLCTTCSESLASIEVGLKEMKVRARADDRLVRGLDYYTRTVFELKGGGGDRELAQSSLGGGGRYDNLVKDLGGAALAAVGFSSGLERIALSLEDDESGDGGGVYFAVLEREAFAAAAKLVDTLRNSGVRALWDYSTSALKKQMGRAAKSGATHAVIIGAEELSGKKAQVKDLSSGEQLEVGWEGLAGHLSELSEKEN